MTAAVPERASGHRAGGGRRGGRRQVWPDRSARSLRRTDIWSL